MFDMFGDDINKFEEEFDKNFDETFYQSLVNSYDIFLGNKTYSDILAEQPKPHFFFFDPLEPPTKVDVQDLMDMFEDYEEYEKCGELLNLIKYAY